MIDMRMPFTFGHSRAVAGLAGAAGGCMGLPEDDIRAIRWAGYTHDIGELAVPVSTWLKAARFSPREADAAHLHPYHGERALAALGADGQPVAALVLRHHERLDGSGYHRYAKAPDLSPAARILAAAEAYQTAIEERPHRPASSAGAAAASLRSLVAEGKLCPDGAQAVLDGRRTGVAPHGARSARRPHPTRNRGASVDSGGSYRERSGATLEHLAQDRRQPHPESLLQDRCIDPSRRGALRARARTCRKGTDRRIRASSSAITRGHLRGS